MQQVKEDQIRSWRPGDGVRCTYTKQAAIGVPCGPPVAVIEKPFAPVDRASTTRAMVLCENHLAAKFMNGGWGKFNAEAEKYAREALIVEHWDEYQKLVKDRRSELIEQVTSAIPEKFRPLVERGIAAFEGSS